MTKLYHYIGAQDTDEIKEYIILSEDIDFDVNDNCVKGFELSGICEVEGKETALNMLPKGTMLKSWS